MNDVIVRAVDLTKVYRLYAKPHYRFLDMFGLLSAKRDAYTEHHALQGINLEICRGERVAFIGRNGAGKSTLLKLATSVIEPTSGRIEVAEGASALLQIGAGFHPDFTGRQNAYSYLSHLGVTGAEADAKVIEIVSFAELEEYIDQPIKTYSTGMVARLMFSTSTAITPRVLVLDEILGVGDAYFAQKSYERIRELCEAYGTTVLLVSHDIYSAAALCERMIWIDRGQVMIDGASNLVTKAYEDSIRVQEERRLRAKKQLDFTANNAPSLSAEGAVHLIFEIQAKDNQTQPCPAYFSCIALTSADGETLASLPLGAGTNSGASHLIFEQGCWGEVVEWHDRLARQMLNHGSPFLKIGGVFTVPSSALETGAGLTVSLDYWTEQPCDLVLRGYLNEVVLDFGELPPARNEWVSHVAVNQVQGKMDSTAKAPQLQTSGIQGSRKIIITSFAMVDSSGQETFTLKHGEPVRFQLGFKVLEKDLHENADLFIIISRNNTERVCKFMTSALAFDERLRPEGVLEMGLPKMMLSEGTYAVAVEVAAEGYVERGMTKFFSIDPEVYHCISNAIEFTVIDSGWIGPATVFEGEGEWRFIGEAHG